MRHRHVHRLVHETKTKALSISTSMILIAMSLGGALPALLSQRAYAVGGSTVVNSTSGSWSTADTRPGGAVSLATDSSAPSGAGALRLTTNTTNTAKAQFLTSAGVKLSAVTDASYQTKQNSPTPSQGDASYQIAVDLNNDGNPATTINLVYEPYYNGAVTTGTWQSWNVLAGKFWPSQNVPSLSGAGGGAYATNFTIGDVLAAYPNARVTGFGVNVGSYNPSYNVEVDNLGFNGTTYDFEPVIPTIAITPVAGSVLKATGNTTFTATSDTTHPSYMYVELNHSGTWIAANTGGGNSTSLTYNTGSLAEGTYTIKVDAIENNGNSEERLFNYTVDHTAPTSVTVTPINADGSSVVSGVIPFTISATDPNYSYSYLEINQNGNWITDNTHGTSSYSGSTLSWDWDSSTVPNGIYTLKADAVDKAGNTTEQNINFTVDHTVPSIPSGLKSTSQNGSDITNGATNVNFVKNSWSPATHAAKYNYEFRKPGLPTYTTTTTNTSVQGQFDGATSPEGQYAFRVQAVSASGVVSTWSDWSNVSYDHTNPIVTITPTGSLIHGQQQFTANVTDANLGSNASHAYVTLYNTSGTKHTGVNVNLSSGSATFTIDTTKLDDGAANVSVDSFTDQAGNKSGDGIHASYFYGYTVDNTRPTITFVTPSSFNTTTYNQYLQSGPDFEIHATDTNGVANTVLHIYNSDGSPAKFCNVSYTATVSCNVSSLADGTYHVLAGATDNAGNNQTVTKYFTVDGTAPVVNPITYTDSSNATKNAQDSIIRGAVTFHATQTENNPSRMYVEYDQLVNGHWQKVAHNGYVNDVNSVDLTVDTTGWADGQYQVKVSTDDKAGNHGGRSATFTVDNTKPILKITAPAMNSAQKGTITVSGTATDNLSGVAGQTVTLHLRKVKTNGSLDGFLNTFTATVHPDGTWSTTLDVSTLNGQYGITGFVNDVAGNSQSASGGASIKPFTIDNIVPDAPTLTSPQNKAVVNGSSVTQSWSDSSTDVDHYIYESFNDAAATSPRFSDTYTGTSKTATNVTDGTTYWWRVTAVDHAGNVSAPSPLWKITIDNKAPVVAITGPTDGDTVRGTVVVSGTVTDNNPDHYYFVAKDSHGSVVAGPGTVNQANVADWNWNTNTVADGIYTIDLEARDAAGNKDATSTKIISVTVDNTAPTLAINPSTGTDTTPTLTGTTSDATDVVTVDGQTATVDPSANSGGSHNWSITLPAQTVGSHTVTVVSTDLAGNATTETATVVVTAPAAPATPTATSTPAAPTVTITPNGNRAANSTAVLGASTTTPNSSDTTGISSDVKGDSTTKHKSDDSKSSGNFLGLGWWWLLIIAIAGFLWWLLAARRRDSEEDTK